MKILTFKRLVGVAALGGLAYIHKQRGGKWTAASIMDTLRQLWSSAGRTLTAVQQRTTDTLERAANLTEPPAYAAPAEAQQARSYSGQSKRKDETGRH